LLAATYDALPTPAADIFRGHIEKMRWASRPLSWTEVLFYPERAQSSRLWTEAELFPNRHEDLRIAEIKFRAGDKRYACAVHIVLGHFFAITSRPGLKGVARVHPDISTVTIVADPMDPLAAPPKRLPSSYRKFVSAKGAGAHLEWDVIGPDEVYEVSLDGGAFWVLATRAGEAFLLARQKGDAIYVCATDDDPRRIKEPFEQALEKY
jgi:hypothetical protein